AFIENYNVFLRPAGVRGEQETGAGTASAGGGRGNNLASSAIPLSFDGSEGNKYTFRSIAWSPDSRHLAAYHTRPGFDRQVHYIESSPAGQVQPKHTTISYRKPGDALDIAYPVLFDVQTRTGIELDNSLFP